LPEVKLAGSILRRGDVPPTYLARGRPTVPRWTPRWGARAQQATQPGRAGALDGLWKHPGRGDALRLVGYRLLDLKQPALASQLFARVLRQRPFEPHSFRDLARSLEEVGRYGWPRCSTRRCSRATGTPASATRRRPWRTKEYARMLREALACKAVGGTLAAVPAAVERPGFRYIRRCA
jgi:hypothetical protein